MPRTQHIMKGLRARLDLLLQVTIAPGEGIHVARSVSNNQESGMLFRYMGNAVHAVVSLIFADISFLWILYNSLFLGHQNS